MCSWKTIKEQMVISKAITLDNGRKQGIQIKRIDREWRNKIKLKLKKKMEPCFISKPYFFFSRHLTVPVSLKNWC